MRLYNGAPDSALKAIWDERDRILKEAKENGIFLTWFPIEERWAACTSMDNDEPYRSLGGFHHTMRGALDEALIRIKETT